MAAYGTYNSIHSDKIYDDINYSNYSILYTQWTFCMFIKNSILDSNKIRFVFFNN